MVIHHFSIYLLAFADASGASLYCMVLHDLYSIIWYWTVLHDIARYWYGIALYDMVLHDPKFVLILMKWPWVKKVLYLSTDERPYYDLHIHATTISTNKSLPRSKRESQESPCWWTEPPSLQIQLIQLTRTWIRPTTLTQNPRRKNDHNTFIVWWCLLY